MKAPAGRKSLAGRAPGNGLNPAASQPSRPGELAMLFEISQLLDSSLDLRTVVEPVLEVITRSLGMMFATLTLLNRRSGEISIESAWGLSPSQKQRGRYRLGEGITGKVIESGKPAIVPHISAEPGFLDRTRARRNLASGDLSFVCVPIKIGRETVGALSVDRLATEEASLQEDARVLSIVSSLIAQAVRLRQSAQEHRGVASRYLPMRRYTSCMARELPMMLDGLNRSSSSA